MNLGDFLKPNHIIDKIKPGSVIRLMAHDTTPPKIKRFVVVGVCEKTMVIGRLFINSELNKFKQKTYLYQYQVELSADDCDFLTHDSWLDCTEIMEEDLDIIVNKIVSSKEDCFIGELNTHYYEDMIRCIANTRTIDVATKKRYGIT